MNDVIIIDKNGNVTEKKCFASFHGIDGKGTCNTACQWYQGDCIMWTPELEDDHFNEHPENEEYQPTEEEINKIR